MRLLDLPLELLHEILRWSIQVRGIKRGLRLRLVNKIFAREILTTLSIFKLLDIHFKPVPIGKNAAITSLAIAYLKRRVLNERHGGAPVLLRICSVATRLCQESLDGRDEHDYIRQLSPLVLDTCRVRLDEIWAPNGAVPSSDGILYGSDLDTDVYIAALYTQTWPVIARWISNGKELARNSLIFGTAHCHAAKYCSHEVLAAMMNSRYECDFQALRLHFLQKVAGFGRVEATRFVFDFQAAQRPWAFSRKIKRPSYPFNNEKGLARLHTPSKEVFDFITAKRRAHCINRTFGVRENTAFLIHCAQNGWVDMTAHYLALGASVNGSDSSAYDEEQRPLLGACRNGHEEVVKVLLDHGADTCPPALETAVRYGQFAIVFLLLDRGAELGGAIAEAVAKGYRTIVHALLKHGTDDKPGLQGLLVRSIELEDEALFRLLIEYNGGVIDVATRAACAEVAREKGLESMAQLI